MPQEEKRISSRELISAERVMEIWSVSGSELIEEIQRGNFTVLFCSKKPRKAPNGDVLFLCWEGTYKNIYYHNDFPHNEDTYYDFSNVYLYAIDISGHQIKFPHLAMPTADDSETSQNYNINSTDPEWMPAHEARVVIGMTPINFVSLLNFGALETDKEQERLDFAKTNGWETDNVPFFKTNDLDTLRVHKASFSDYTSETYVGRKIDTSILKYHENKDQVVGEEEVGHNENVEKYEPTASDTFLSADDLCKRWSLSPTQLVDLIRNYSDLAVYWEENDVPF
jgi:hypothetical protein